MFKQMILAAAVAGVVLALGATARAAIVDVTLNAATTTWDLTAAGPTDWVYWNANNVTAGMEKASSDWINETLTDYPSGASHNQITNLKVTVSWTDGTPTPSGSSNTSLNFQNTGGPLEITVDAKAGYTHTLTMLLGGHTTNTSNTYTLTATLDAGNGSATDSDSFTMGTGFTINQHRFGVVEYTPDVDGTLTVSWKHTGGLNIFLTAAALEAVPEPATLALLGLGGVGLVLSRKRR